MMSSREIIGLRPGVACMFFSGSLLIYSLKRNKKQSLNLN
jgi:hypothetical protein